MNRVFIDSNIWVYAFAGNSDPRGAIAQAFLYDHPNNNELVISYQVVNEVTRILKKYGHSEMLLRQTISNMLNICEFINFSQNSAILASELRETMSISYWDSHIAASAILSDCGILASEDFQDGSIIRGVRIYNIFNL
ncbi:MAG: PIN domain-containing protein [Oscillospiraceae bacterium]|nr:PIN domain-containing protein [Oscillospiraceae bacterium]